MAMIELKDGHKHCKACGLLLLLESFEGNRNTCKECRNAQRRAQRCPTKEKYRKLLYRYQITQDEYDLLYQQQNGKCAGCFLEKPLVCDHDHSCCSELPTCGNCNRGLICDDCNVALGRVYDSPAILRNLATYVERNTKLDL